jgi:HEAT repeats
MRRRLIWTAVMLVGIALPAQAGGGLFRKGNKPDPATHVPQLIEIIKTSKDEKARAEAVNDLRDYDAKVFTEIHPVLIEALANDPSSSVRDEAATAIGKVRPISHKAGYALEQARSHDKSLMVRLSAQSALLNYRILGYFGGSKADTAVAQTAEPPLAKIPVPSSVVPASTVKTPEGPLTPTPVPMGGRSTSAKPSILPTVIGGRVQTPEPPKAVDPGKIPTIVPPPLTPRTFVPPPSDDPKPAQVAASGKPTIIVPIPGDKGTPAITTGNAKPKTPPVEDGPTLGPPPR